MHHGWSYTPHAPMHACTLTILMHACTCTLYELMWYSLSIIYRYKYIATDMQLTMQIYIDRGYSDFCSGLD